MTTHYYHGSRKLFERGAVLVPQADGYANLDENSEFEALVESRRPENKTPRGKSVFLVTDIDLIDASGGYNDAVYRVKPMSLPEESDLAWYTEAFCEHDGGNEHMERAIEFIDKYWSGTPFIEPERRCPEFRCKRAEVVNLHELNVDRSELERVLDMSPSP